MAFQHMLTSCSCDSSIYGAAPCTAFLVSFTLDIIPNFSAYSEGLIVIRPAWMLQELPFS
jgi:hypothetical protein